MFLSATQIARSLVQLHGLNPFFGTSLLIFKAAEIPVGSTVTLNFASLAKHYLAQYFRAAESYAGFYNPFPGRWVAPRYYHTTLQRITVGTFRDVLYHKTASSDWGWDPLYLTRLRNHLKNTKIPAFALAAWLYRNEHLPPDASPQFLRAKLFNEFKFTQEEISVLFDLSDPSEDGWLREEPITEPELLAIIGAPPGSPPAPGAALSFLRLTEVGPVIELEYEPGPRLNIITGDNSLGKTFILECIWWALTGEWLGGNQAAPRRSAAKSAPALNAVITPARGAAQEYGASYDWDRQRWTVPSKRNARPGLVVYARYDGSFAVWDPTRVDRDTTDVPDSNSHGVFFRQQDIWDGLTVERGGRREFVCEGLVRDWPAWMRDREHRRHYGALVACLKTLSPSPAEPLAPGQPTRQYGDARLIPTLTMPYGDVPVLQSSAGVQRAIALAYVLVWAWHEHLAASEQMRRKPERHIVFIIDEAEAHLHPRWQRTIVPALMKVVSQLTAEATTQVHLATHSPLVMASAEGVFDPSCDALHHLRLDKRHVVLEPLPFVKRGRVDLWLMSDVFGLAHARSLPAEAAIEKALALQTLDDPPSDDVVLVDRELRHVLAPDDDFWPRWRHFALEHGVTQ